MMSDAEINAFITQKMGVERDYCHSEVAASGAYAKLISKADAETRRLYFENLCRICETQTPNPGAYEKSLAIVETFK